MSCFVRGVRRQIGLLLPLRRATKEGGGKVCTSKLTTIYNAKESYSSTVEAVWKLVVVTCLKVQQLWHKLPEIMRTIGLT